MLSFKGMPISLTHREAGAIFMGLVNEETSSVEACLKRTNYSLLRVSYLELHLLIDLISNIVESLLNKDDLVDVI